MSITGNRSRRQDAQGYHPVDEAGPEPRTPTLRSLLTGRGTAIESEIPGLTSRTSAHLAIDRLWQEAEIFLEDRAADATGNETGEIIHEQSARGERVTGRKIFRFS